jgi:hypothetical protein
LSLRDNHHQIATDFLIQIVALFSPRLSRYSPRSDIQNSRSLFKVCRKTPDHIGHVNRLGVLDVLQTMVLIEGNNSIALIEVVPRTRPEIPSADSDEGARL